MARPGRSILLASVIEEFRVSYLFTPRPSAGQVQLPKEFGKKGSTASNPTTVHRASTQGYAKGQTIFILDDPNGTPWIMQVSSKIVDPKLTYDVLCSFLIRNFCCRTRPYELVSYTRGDVNEPNDLGVVAAFSSHDATI